jgi:hypothetical protein
MKHKLQQLYNNKHKVKTKHNNNKLCPSINDNHIRTYSTTTTTKTHLSGSSGNGFPVGTTAVLVGVAGAVGKVRTFSRSEIIRTTAELGGNAAAALEVLALRRRDVI